MRQENILLEMFHNKVDFAAFIIKAIFKHQVVELTVTVKAVALALLCVLSFR